MTEEEFFEKYCQLCGTIVCGGVYDEPARDGCARYREEFLGETREEREPWRIFYTPKD